MTHFKRSLMLVVGLLTVSMAACSEKGPADPDDKQPGLHIIAGANITDTIDAPLTQALVVEVRDSFGKLAPGSIVKFESRPADDTTRKDRTSYVCKLTASACGSDGSFPPLAMLDTADANGRAKGMIRLGRVAGRAVIRASVEALALIDSATYTVTPGAPARVRAATTDTIVNIGATATLRGRVVDRYNNPRTETVTHTISAGSAAALDAATAVVTGQAIGSQWLYARYNNFVDSTNVAVAPAARFAAYAFNSAQLRMLNSNGSNVRVLASNLGGGLGVFPHFDQTRQRVTFHAVAATSFSNASVMDTTGAPRRDIGPGTNFVTIMTVRLLADGTIMLVANRIGTPGFVVWRVAPDNTVTFVAAPPGMIQKIGSADFSPDGSKVVYQSLTDLPSDLRVYDFASATFKVLRVGGTSPRWSPTGDRVAFLAGVGDRTGGDGIGIINADGTGARVLGNAAYLSGISWSPDAAYIVGRNEPGGLRMVRVSDGADVVLRFRNASREFEEYIQPDWR